MAEYETVKQIIADRDRLRSQLAQVTAERDKARAWRQCADHLADEVDVLIRRRVIDWRSPAADALLDYRDPESPTSERSDRILSLEADISSARALADVRGREVERVERERDAYRSMLCDLLASAHPHPKEHPTMTREWDRARHLLKTGELVLAGAWRKEQGK